MWKTKACFSITDYQWLMAFLFPYAVGLAGVLLSKKSGFSPDQRILWSVLVNSAIILVVLGVMYLCRWRLADLGVRWQGLRSGLLAAGLIFVFMAVPEWYAAYPWRWQSLDDFTVYDAAKYLSVSVAEELWFRGLVYISLERRWNRRVAVLGTAIAFGLAHLHHGIVRVFLTGIDGIASSLARARTGNIIGLMLSHWFLDFMYKLFVPYQGMPSAELIVIKAATLLVLLLLLWRAPFLATSGGHGESGTACASTA